MNDTCSLPSHDAQHSGLFEPGPGKNVLYFGDPMCSWCWGFAPELSKINAAIAGKAQLHLVMGGLRPGTVEPWDAKMRDYIRHHWQEVADKTGQPFDFSRFDDARFVYDTEPACRALVAVRSLDPERALPFYEALQRGFYAQGLNATDSDVLATIAQSVGLDRTRFIDAFNHPDVRAKVAFDFSRTRAFGVSGFPSVLCADNGQYAFLSLGYGSYETVAARLQEWLNA